MARSDVAPAACSSFTIGARSGGPPCRLLLPDDQASLALLGSDVVATIATQHHTALLGGLQRCLGPGRDHASLKFGNSCHLLEHELAGGAFQCRQIGEAHIDAGIEQTR